jgi:hypothetical protein
VLTSVTSGVVNATSTRNVPPTATARVFGTVLPFGLVTEP